MKKLIISICLLTTISCGRVGNAINPVSANNCEKSVSDWEKTLTVYTQNPSSKANCEAYKKALEDIIKSCAVYTAAQKRIYEDQIKQLTCN